MCSPLLLFIIFLAARQKTINSPNIPVFFSKILTDLDVSKKSNNGIRWLSHIYATFLTSCIFMKISVIGVSMVLVIALITIITLVVLRLRKKKARKLTRVISLPSFTEEQLQDTSFSPSLATAGQTDTIPPSSLSEDQEE